MAVLAQRIMATPIGKLRLVATDAALVAILFPGERGAPPGRAESVARHPVLDLATRELGAYFAGKSRAFTTPMAARGTEFQRLVWKALTEIPYGETATYSGIARAIARPLACRAVGMANNKNPLSVMVPCHRVIGADGSMTGYGGGLPRKRWLLAHESATAARPRS